MENRELEPAARTTPWPPVGHERVVWHFSERARGALDAVVLARWEGRDYQASVPPAIAALDPLAALGSSVVEDASEAQAEIRAFEREAAALPVPMPAVLLRTESASSSQIENLTVNARNLAQAVIGLPSGLNGSIVAANVAAMTEALDVSESVTIKSVLAIHEALLRGSDPDAGKFRTEPVWVGRRSNSPHRADFVPPTWQRVEGAVRDFVAFASAPGGGALLRAGIAHAQFETIHPFSDGNGRTGRALVHTMLKRAAVVRDSTVPVSAGLLADINGYIAALTAYREGQVEPIVATFAAAARSAVANGRTLAGDVSEIRERWRDQIAARRDASVWRLADALFAQPVVNTAFVATQLGVSVPTAIAAIDKLAETGVLTQTNRDRRNRLWQAADVLEAMDAFADRTRRGRL